jgi:hypothetical protein
MNKESMRFFSIILSIFIFCLAGARVLIANSDSTEGDKLTRILTSINSLEHTNQDLTQQVASASALFSLAQKAQGMGFAQKTQFVTFNTPLPLALSKESSL